MYHKISEYILNAIPYMMVALPFIILIRIIVFHKHKGIYSFNLYREVILSLFFMYCIGLASQTIIPKLEFGTVVPGIVNSNLNGEINFTPGRVFIDIYRECIQNRHYQYFVINFIGNLLLFFPIGFGIPLLWRNVSLKKVFIIGIAISLSIEIIQLFEFRGTDIDDLWLNALGTLSGYGLYKLLLKSHFFQSLFLKSKTLDNLIH